MTNPPPHQPRPNLLLIGLRMSGKSTLARALAHQHNLPFIDLDDAVLKAMGRDTVAQAWQQDGEPAFRKTESETLARELQATGQIIALGGGTPTAPGAADTIRNAQHNGAAIVIYLRCSPEELRRRLTTYAPGENRPGLTDKGTSDEVQDIFDTRDPLYQSLADHTLNNIQTLDQALAAINPLW